MLQVDEKTIDAQIREVEVLDSSLYLPVVLMVRLEGAGGRQYQSFAVDLLVPLTKVVDDAEDVCTVPRYCSDLLTGSVAAGHVQRVDSSPLSISACARLGGLKLQRGGANV